MSNPLYENIKRDPRYAQADGAQLVDAVLQRLRTGGYSYTLEPGVYGIHTADEFWFDRKQGFCEHIASSFVLLMRALDVPARVVMGYQGAEPPDADGFRAVRLTSSRDEDLGEPLMKAFLGSTSFRLRSLSRGTGEFTLEIEGYEQVPHDVQEKLAKAYAEKRHAALHDGEVDGAKATIA